MQNKFVPSLLSAQNHLRIQGQASEFRVSVSRCARQVLDFRSECGLVAQHLRSLAPRRLTLAFDGSPFAVAIFETLRQSNIEFNCSIVRFQKSLNIQMTSQAVVYCENHSVPYSFIEIDILQLMKSPAFLSMVLSHRAGDLLNALSVVHCSEILRAQRFPIFSGSVPVLRKLERGWSAIENESEFALHRFCLSKNVSACPSFFRWTPEIRFAFLNDPYIRKLAMNRIPGCSDFHDKSSEFLSNYFKLMPNRNFGPHEKIADDAKRFDRELRTKTSPPVHAISTPYPSALQSLKPQLTSRVRRPVDPSRTL